MGHLTTAQTGGQSKQLKAPLQLPLPTHQLAPGYVEVADGRCQVEHGAGAQRPQRLGQHAEVLRWRLGCGAAIVIRTVPVSAQASLPPPHRQATEPLRDHSPAPPLLLTTRYWKMVSYFIVSRVPASRHRRRAASTRATASSCCGRMRTVGGGATPPPPPLSAAAAGPTRGGRRVWWGQWHE